MMKGACEKTPTAHIKSVLRGWAHAHPKVGKKTATCSLPPFCVTLRQNCKLCN